MVVLVLARMTAVAQLGRLLAYGAQLVDVLAPARERRANGQADRRR
jgi:hypothetical protein